MPDIVVIDYGMGNLRSVAKAIEHVAPEKTVAVSSDPDLIGRASHVIFPGQGAMPDCMRELDARGLRAVVVEAARSKPFLGLCIGLQMLFDHSEEGDTSCLGLLRGRVVRFASGKMFDDSGAKLKIPHMGWNEVRQTVRHPLWEGIPDNSRYYFVHSYYVQVEDEALTAGVSRYPFPFTCAVARNNIFAVQFHPEKSQTAGLQLLSNFVQWDGVFSANSVAALGTADA